MVFARIYKSELSVDGEEYIKDTALDFCRKQKLKEAMLKSVGLLKNSSFNEISEVINSALKLGCSRDFGYDYKVDFEKRFQLKARNPVSTGWRIIDDLTKGGLGSGELGVVIAPTGAGKSMVLVHLGAQALREGKTVVHYTLELQDTVVATRYDSCLTGIPLQKVFLSKDEIYENVKDIEGDLIIKEYPTKTATPQMIRNHLEKLRQRDINVDVVLVDYGDLLRPNIVRKEKRHELETIYEDLRAEVITMESISEAFNKCFVADFIVSISRTIEDKASNTGRAFVAKNRNGPDGLVYPIFMDTSNVNIDVLPSQGETVTSVIEESTKKQKELLTEKYKRFKEAKK
jgi:KaiC/GvpD/RAD55 family RecA-like ATPase